MIIKIIDSLNEETIVNKREFVAEATQYNLQKIEFDNETDMWEYLHDYGNYHSPFNLHIKPGAREVVILDISEPSRSVIVATNCHVFVMNSDGKTIDRFSVAGELPEAEAE